MEPNSSIRADPHPPGAVIITTPHLLALRPAQADEQMDGSAGRGCDADVQLTPAGRRRWLGLPLHGAEAQRICCIIYQSWMSAGEESADLHVCYQPNTSDHLLPPPSPQPLSISLIFNGKRDS